MSVVERVRGDIFAEPSGNRLNWLAVAFGVLSIGVLVVGLTDLYLEYVLMGVGFVFMGSAELISTEYQQLAGILRLCSMAAFALLAAIYVPQVIL